MQFDRLFDDLCQDEGFREHPYQDTLGRWTIGYGNCYILGEKVTAATPPVTQRQAMEMLMADAYGACMDAQGMFSNFNILDSVRQEVLVNMAFNLGGRGLERFVKLHDAVINRDWPEAAAQIEDSNYFRQVGARAVRQRDRMLTGHR